jgi:uncharacterized coiled-coil protein SlyX
MRAFAILIILFYQLCIFNQPSWADSSVEEEMKVMKEQFAVMQTKMNSLEDKVARQQKQINGYEASKQAYETRITDLEGQLAKQSTTSAAPVTGGNHLIPSKWTPEIGVVADTLFTLNSAKTDTDGEDRLNVRELELVMGSAVDPFSRLDATIAFSTSEDEPVALEEAYLTRFGLPFDSTARIGKFKPKVGKALGVHRDSLDTIDEPLVIQRYFGEEGMNKTGVDISKILDLPTPVTQQITVGVLDGGNAEDVGVFGETKRRPTLYSHLKNYIDINDATGFELGGSYMAGSRDEDSRFEVQVLGMDATLTHNFNANQNMKIQAEAFNVDRKESVIDEDDGLGGTIRHDLDGNIWGAYGLVDFRVHPLWSIGGRYDIVQPIAAELPVDGVRKDDQAYSGYLTFYQSEFARWRMQFTHTDSATGKDDNAAYIQGTFAIGEHKHKIQ